MQIRIDLTSEIDITDKLYELLKELDVNNVIISNDVEQPELFI